MKTLIICLFLSYTITAQDENDRRRIVTFHLMNFEMKAKQYGVDLTKGGMLSIATQFAKIGKDSKGRTLVAECSNPVPEDRTITRIITIDPDWFYNATHYQIEVTLFHEFCHCLLNRMGHTMTLKKGKPTSIMYDELLNMKYYLKNREKLIKELFKK